MANIVKGQIGNALESVAPDGIVATADAIYDETKGKSQEQINEDIKQSLAEQANNIGYYECGTAAATAAKEITGGSYKLPEAAPYGGSIKVKFTYKNSAANPTLSINLSDPKPLYYNGSIASSTNTWEDGDVLDLYYDGINFNARSVVEKFATGEKVKNVGIDAEPIADSKNLVESGGIKKELVLGAVYDVSAKNPTAGSTNDGKWESLSTLLSDASIDTLIPTSVRRGGMSIKFIQSSDNKYMQYRLTADEWSVDTNNWAIVDDGVYVDNPEFIYVKTDAKGNILFGIKVDGEPYFGVGCPKQVKEYIIDNFANIKVDKEEGKSLIDADYAEGVSQIENLEFVEVHTDADNKILYGVKQDGDFYFGAGIPSQIQKKLDSKVEADEIVEFVADKVDKEEGKSLIDADYASSQSVVETPEYIEAKTDSEGKLLAGRTPDGVAFERVGFTTPKASIDGYTIENIEDIEKRAEILTDSEGKILSFRDEDGVKHEEVGISTNVMHSETINSKTINTNQVNILSNEGLSNLSESINKSFSTVRDAIDEGRTGVIQVGENIVVGLHSLERNYTAKDIEQNYKNVISVPKFPFIKKVSLHRLYDDAETPNMLYICNHSDKHIFYSICPTQAKHIDYNSFDEYNSNYFYYADKNTPSDIHKVLLPNTVDGIAINRRIKYIFEMSNGDCLIEIENGSMINSKNGHHNIYKVSNVFSGITIQENDITLSLSFDYYNERISAFDQIVEYKAGHIVLAPYGNGRTGKVYITKDYGNTWDLIFCSDTENSTHYIKPKAQRLGEENAYGVWPTSEFLVAENTLDWSATSNGNVHIHGIAYDSWYDRIWICTGDGAFNKNDVTGIWWTDDMGYTWKRVGGYVGISTHMSSQMMGVIPMEHCVLFSTDGKGDGFFRWCRNGKDTIIKIEECYNYLGYRTDLVIEAGRSIVTKNGFCLTSFAPDNINDGDWINKGGIVATCNGFDFEKIYEDSFSEGTFETAEIGWQCDITDCDNKLILSADKGGFIELIY